MGSARSLPLQRRAVDALAAGSLLVLPWLLYGAALDLWWTQDDFFQVRFATTYAPVEYTFEPEVWRTLPNQVLSPLLFVSYDVDLAVAGLAPAAFYAHQLLAIGLAALALYAVLRLWLTPGWCLLGGVVFLLGPPIASMAPLLMVRHYPESLFLGLLSALAFVVAVRRQRAPAWVLAGLSAVLCLAASLAKEVAAPLPAVFALLPAGTPRRRLLLLLPHFGALVAYAIYRVWMLGTPFGGYGWVVLPGEWPGLALGLPWKIARELAGPSPWGWIALTGFAGAILVACWNRRGAALIVVGLLVALLPVLPVATEVVPRYAAASWFLLAAALGPAARVLAASGPRPGAGWSRRRSWSTAGLAVLLAAALAANRGAWREQYGRAARMSVENVGFLELGRGELLRLPLGPPASMIELRRFAGELLGRSAEGGWFYDDLFLCERATPVRALWTFDPARGQLKNITRELPVLRRAHCRSIRWEAPLEVVFRRDRGILSWELGPEREGGWAFLLEDGRMAYEVPRRGAFHVGDLALAGLRVRFDSSRGWVTYSPPLDLEGSGGSGLRWHRP